MHVVYIQHTVRIYSVITAVHTHTHTCVVYIIIIIHRYLLFIARLRVVYKRSAYATSKRASWIFVACVTLLVWSALISGEIAVSVRDSDNESCVILYNEAQWSAVVFLVSDLLVNVGISSLFVRVEHYIYMTYVYHTLT